MAEQIQCPSCKSYDVGSFKQGALKFGFGCSIAAIIAFYGFDTTLYISIPFLLLGVLCIFNGIRNEDSYTCNGCKFKFQTGKIQ